ncbi:MAG: DUF3843 family protein [Bacteroidetes bacterium]|nr:DUF3843 family protein [Bacteroidota bacterium]NCQ11690.1 DUF3843 family protein [Bacteroidota bacterium]
MNKINRIFINYWLKYKPYQKQQSSDFFYLNLANRIKKTFLTHPLASDLILKYSDDSLNDLSCMIASYLEDLVSNTNIWNTFIRLNKEFYGKPLPFYDCNDYVEEEINLDDINFLVWYFRSCYDENIVKFTNNSILSSSINSIYELLEEAWEIAPENNAHSELFTLSTDADFLLYSIAFE